MEIKISKILTPWVQLGFAIYLNHFKENTKSVIKGTSIGVQYEWMCHNIAYYAMTIAELFGANYEKEIGRAKDVDVGSTIFADSHSDNKIAEFASTGMKISYAITVVPWLIDLGISIWGI